MLWATASVVICALVGGLLADFAARWVRRVDDIGAPMWTVVGALGLTGLLLQLVPLWFRAGRRYPASRSPRNVIRRWAMGDVHVFQPTTTLVLSLAGLGIVASLVASGWRAQRLARRCSVSARCGTQETEQFLDLRGEYVGTLAAAVLLALAALVLTGLAIRALTLTDRSSHHRMTDIYLLAALLSVVLGAVVVPTYLALQSAGSAMVQALLGSNGPVTAEWVERRESLLHLLAPWGPTTVMSGVVAVLAPLGTGLLGFVVSLLRGHSE